MSKNYLENWKKWLDERKRLQNYLAKCLKRTPGDLLMNLGEDMRGIQEEKMLLDYAKIEIGKEECVNFWKMPLELVFKRNRYERSYLFKTKTLEEKGIVPDFECVGIAKHILEEKHIFPKTRSLWTQWNKMEYRKMKIKELQEKLNTIQPHRPEFTNLIIVGNKVPICNEKTNKNGAETIKIEGDIKKPKTTLKLQKIVLQTIPLIINGCQFYQNELDTTKSFLIPFTDFIINSGKCATKFLTFENQSNTALIISFREIEPYNLFQDLIPCRRRGIVFLFKRDDIFLAPGQKLEHPIRFKTNKPGSYNEIWEICTTPKLWQKPAKIIVKLKGFADITTMAQCKQLQDELEKHIQDCLIKNVVSELLQNVNVVTKNEPIYFLHYYDEEKLFETVNSLITPYKNMPKYKYNRVIVEKLKELYESVREELDAPPQWDYSLETLRKLLFFKSEKLHQFQELIGHLDAPFPLIYNHSINYRPFFAFLNAAITQSCNEIHKLENNFGIIFQPRYPNIINATEKRLDSKRSRSKLTTKKPMKSSSHRLLRKGSVDSKTRNKSKISIASLETKIINIKIPDNFNLQYKHNLYVIFYTNLCKAIDAIETAIVSKEAELSHKCLQTLNESNKYYDSDEINVNTLIAELLKREEEVSSSVLGKLATSTVSACEISYPETMFLADGKDDGGVVAETDQHSTSTLEGGQIDLNWLRFKERSAQTSQISTEFDLVQQVEILQEATSLQDIQFSKEVGCQKETNEHVSDEEYFYSSTDEN